MKLHLPSGLRKALLACLAAVALPAATIPTTIASASGIAAVFLIASQRASADEPSWVDVSAGGGEVSTETLSAQADSDLKLTISGDVTFASGAAFPTGKQVMITSGGAYTATVTSSNGGLFSGVTDIWSSVSQLIFDNTVDFSGASKLTANLHLGGGNYTGGSDDKLKWSTLRVAGKLETDGGLEMTAEGKISMEGDGELTINGNTNLTQQLRISHGGEGSSKVSLLGGGSLNLVLDSSGVDLYIGGETAFTALSTSGFGGKIYLVDGAEVTYAGVTALADLSKLDNVLTQDPSAVNGGGAIVLTSGGTGIGGDNGSTEDEGHYVRTSFGVVLNGSSQTYDFNNASFEVGGNVKVGEGNTLKLRNASVATIKGTVDVRGTLQYWSSNKITLEKGGFISNLDIQWGGTRSFVLGGDLEVGNSDWTVTDGSVSFEKLAETSENVHVVFKSDGEETSTSFNQFKGKLGNATLSRPERTVRSAASG